MRPVSSQTLVWAIPYEYEIGKRVKRTLPRLWHGLHHVKEGTAHLYCGRWLCRAERRAEWRPASDGARGEAVGGGEHLVDRAPLPPRLQRRADPPSVAHATVARLEQYAVLRERAISPLERFVNDCEEGTTEGCEPRRAHGS